MLIAIMLAVVLLLDGLDLAYHAVSYRVRYGEWPTWQVPILPEENGDGP